MTIDLKELAASGGSAFFGIAEYPDYLVTPDGRIYSLKSKRFLKGGYRSQGQYLGVQLKNRDDELVGVYVHRLVCEIANGPCPPGLQCRHLDGNKLNNNIDNLAWGTPLENSSDKYEHGTVGFGEKNPMAVLTWKQAAEIRRTYAQGLVTQKNLAAGHGVSIMTVNRIVNNKTWRTA